MEQNYEKSLKRLEEIVALLEEGGQPLEKTLELFSEGTALISACGKYLDDAEQKITKLLDNGEKDAQ
ncbi:MAG: exodeoxyribonuclease VII small subunit [Clostridia bacterium]|nr:exodeoxyribonuclease VII small subunit [Clostridia bacterium]